jgi:hypothetical protein
VAAEEELLLSISDGGTRNFTTYKGNRQLFEIPMINKQTIFR